MGLLARRLKLVVAAKERNRTPTGFKVISPSTTGAGVPLLWTRDLLVDPLSQCREMLPRNYFDFQGKYCTMPKIMRQATNRSGNEPAVVSCRQAIRLAKLIVVPEFEKVVLGSGPSL